MEMGKAANIGLSDGSERENEPIKPDPNGLSAQCGGNYIYSLVNVHDSDIDLFQMAVESEWKTPTQPHVPTFLMAIVIQLNPACAHPG